MFGNLKILGIVPARAGSKGLPGKNHMNFMGKPLISYAIEAGSESVYIDDVIVTSDCDECIEIASGLTCEVPFKRPKALSEDNTSSADVIIHALEFLKNQGRNYDAFVLIEPTSPLRMGKDIDQALEKMFSLSATSILSVAHSESQHPNFTFSLDKTGKLKTWSEEEFAALRRQELKPAFYLEGSVYASTVDVFIEYRTFVHAGTIGYVVPKWMAIEIDDKIDFYVAEAVFNLIHGESAIEETT